MISKEHRNIILKELLSRQNPWERGASHEISDKYGIKQFHVRRIRRNYSEAIEAVTTIKAGHAADLEDARNELEAAKSEIMRLKIGIAIGITGHLPNIPKTYERIQNRIMADDVIGRGDSWATSPTLILD